jgi:hypothetical protein
MMNLQISHFKEVAAFTATLWNIACLPLLAYYLRDPSGKCCFGLLLQLMLMIAVIGLILDGKKIFAFFNGLLQNGYISNEVFDFMFNSRMGLALIAVLFMMIAPILAIALRFFINSLITIIAK